MIITNKRVLPEELWNACNPSLTSEPRIPFEGTIVTPETLTAGELIEKLRELPAETPIYRSDSEWGAEEIYDVAREDYSGKFVIA